MLLGFAEEVAAEPVLPDGVVLRRTSEAEDMRRIADYQTEVWGFDCSWVAADLIARVSADPGEITVLVAEAVSGSPVPPGRCTTRAPISSRCSAARRSRTGGDAVSIAP